jgi:hypothetical protein
MNRKTTITQNSLLFPLGVDSSKSLDSLFNNSDDHFDRRFNSSKAKYLHLHPLCYENEDKYISPLHSDIVIKGFNEKTRKPDLEDSLNKWATGNKNPMSLRTNLQSDQVMLPIPFPRFFTPGSLDEDGYAKP